MAALGSRVRFEVIVPQRSTCAGTVLMVNVLADDSPVRPVEELDCCACAV